MRADRALARRRTRLAAARQTPDHPEGEGVGLSLRVRPEDVVAHLVVDHVDPLALGIVLAAPLPALRVNEMELPVVEGSAGRLPPVEVVEPRDLGGRKAVVL